MIKIILIVISLFVLGCEEKVHVKEVSSAKIQANVRLKNVIEKPVKWVSKFKNIDGKQLKRESFEDYKNRGKKKRYRRKKNKLLFSPPKETKIKF